MKILILGKGAFGRAIYSVIARSERDVTFWDRGADIMHADVVIIAVPTKAIREVLEFIKTDSLPIIVNCSKGIEVGTHELPYRVVRDVLGDGVSYFSLMGPSFSQEVIEKMPTLVNIGYAKTTTLEEREKMKKLFQADYFRVRLTSSIRAIELAAAMKNVYAIACGMSKGLGFKHNTRAKLIALAIEEILILTETLGFAMDKRALPAVIGDVVMTCSSNNSRNFAFGEMLVSRSVEESLQYVKGVVEGYASTEPLGYLVEKTKGETPLAVLLCDILDGQKDATEIKDRFSRFLKSS